MNVVDLDRELGILVRKSIAAGIEPVIINGLLMQNVFEVANHTLMRAQMMAEQHDKNGMKQKIREGLRQPPSIIDPNESKGN
jgi:hypothetical protein